MSIILGKGDSVKELNTTKGGDLNSLDSKESKEVQDNPKESKEVEDNPKESKETDDVSQKLSEMTVKEPSVDT